MDMVNLNLGPAAAWTPLPPEDWNEASAKHLLRRAGFSALPDQVDRALAGGLEETLTRLFAAPAPFSKPASLAALEKSAPELRRRQAGASPEERLAIRREIREKNRDATLDLAAQWLQLAARPEHSAYEKLGLFLLDVWVVGAEKVRNAPFLHQHHELLRQQALQPYPELAKAVSRSPAMIEYLDLQQSRKQQPNENFARELFELFVLGEGNYSEDDIKQAARAFTGYRHVRGRFQFLRREADTGSKVIFGRKGKWDGDDVIDLAFEQKAAELFLPRELARYYLSETPLPDALLEPLGAWWRSQNFQLSSLIRRFFSSRLFFAEPFRGNFIKSPLHLYLGLLQDLNLSVAPLARFTFVPLRQMGQMLYNPPNVRGWVGGRNWINSSTLAGRRQLVELLFTPLNEEVLNADERIDLEAARTQGAVDFTLGPERLRLWANLGPEKLVDYFSHYLLPADLSSARRTALADYFEGASGRELNARIRTAAMTLLQSTEYQLC